MSEIIEDELGEGYKIVALSGPTHAEEVSLGLPTTIVSASKDEDARNIIQEVFSSKYMRVYTNDDILGVELCGAFKNVLALAAGISAGLLISFGMFISSYFVFGISNFVNELQLSKAHRPILVTPSGSIISLKLIQTTTSQI